MGETVAKKLAYRYKSVDAIITAGQEELKEVEEIGEKIAESVYSFLHDKRNIALINRLKDHKLAFEITSCSISMISDKLNGKSFVVSGIFSRYSRDQIKKMIEAHGGKNVGSISSKTDYILAGDNMGPEKKKKASSLNIPIISEDDFLKMLE